MAFKLLDSVSATGESDSQRFARLIKDHTVQTDITGSPSAVTVRLLGSLNNVVFFELASHVFTASEITAGSAMFHVKDKTVRHVKIDLDTLTGGSSPTVTSLYEGFESRS